MVVMSQLYLCDEPYWSRFHSPPGPLSQPTVHVISDGKFADFDADDFDADTGADTTHLI